MSCFEIKWQAQAAAKVAAKYASEAATHRATRRRQRSESRDAADRHQAALEALKADHHRTLREAVERHELALTKVRETFRLKAWDANSSDATGGKENGATD